MLGQDSCKQYYILCWMKEPVKKKQLKTKKRHGIMAIAKSNAQVECAFW